MTTRNTAKKKVARKKATRKTAATNTNVVASNKVTLTLKQLQGIAAFYVKQNKSVPAFITNKLGA